MATGTEDCPVNIKGGWTASLSQNSSKDINIPSGTRGLLVTIAPYDTLAGMWIMNCNSSGSISTYPIGTAPSRVSLSATTNKLTITSTHSSAQAQVFFIVLQGSNLPYA